MANSVATLETKRKRRRLCWRHCETTGEVYDGRRNEVQFSVADDRVKLKKKGVASPVRTSTGVMHFRRQFHFNPFEFFQKFESIRKATVESLKASDGLRDAKWEALNDSLMRQQWKRRPPSREK